MSLNLFRNTLSQSAPLVLTYLFSFLLAPLMLARLGLAQFGVWAVTGAIAAYARLLDAGIANSLARFIALYDARGDQRAVRECVGLGLLTVSAVVVVAVAASIPGAAALSHSLGVLPVGQMRVVLLSSVAIMGFNAYEGVLAARPLGMRRMVPVGVAATVGNIVNFAASVVALVLTTRLGPYALANAGAEAVGLALAALALVYVAPAPHIALPSRARVREVLGFGIKSQVVTLASLVNQQTDKIVIAVMVGPRVAGAYEVAARVAVAVRSFGLMTLAAMIPSATAALVQGGRELIRRFYGRYTTRSVAISYAFYGAACVSAPFLFVAWLGRAPHDSEAILVLLTLAFVPTMATGVAMTLVTSDGRPGVVARTATIVTLLNIAGTVAFAPVLGLWGVLLGTFAAEVVGSTVFLVRFHRLYALPPGDLLRAVGPSIALAVGLAAPYGVWYAIALPHPAGRWAALPWALATAGLYMLAYWAAASRLELLPERLALRRPRRTSKVELAG